MIREQGRKFLALKGGAIAIDFPKMSGFFVLFLCR
jgi:hypothetical protein